MPRMRDFLATGDLGPVRIGLTPAEVVAALGPADDASPRRRPVYLLRYGSVQVTFLPAPGTDDEQLVGVSIHFDQPDRQVPPPLRFTDWVPTTDTTRAAFDELVAAAGLRPRDDDAASPDLLSLTSGATATFDDGRLHGVHFKRPGRPADRKQVTVSLPTETIHLLNRRARDENVTVPDLLDRLIKAGV